MDGGLQEARRAAEGLITFSSASGERGAKGPCDTENWKESSNLDLGSCPQFFLLHFIEGIQECDLEAAGTRSLGRSLLTRQAKIGEACGGCIQGIGVHGEEGTYHHRGGTACPRDMPHHLVSIHHPAAPLPIGDQVHGSGDG